MDLTVLHTPVAFILSCVIFSAELAIAGVLGIWIYRAAEHLSRRR